MQFEQQTRLCIPRAVLIAPIGSALTPHLEFGLADRLEGPQFGRPKPALFISPTAFLWTVVTTREGGIDALL